MGRRDGARRGKEEGFRRGASSSDAAAAATHAPPLPRSGRRPAGGGGAGHAGGAKAGAHRRRRRARRQRARGEPREAHLGHLAGLGPRLGRRHPRLVARAPERAQLDGADARLHEWRRDGVRNVCPLRAPRRARGVGDGGRGGGSEDGQARELGVDAHGRGLREQRLVRQLGPDGGRDETIQRVRLERVRRAQHVPRQVRPLGGRGGGERLGLRVGLEQDRLLRARLEQVRLERAALRHALCVDDAQRLCTLLLARLLRPKLVHQLALAQRRARAGRGRAGRERATLGARLGARRRELDALLERTVPADLEKLQLAAAPVKHAHHQPARSGALGALRGG